MLCCLGLHSAVCKIGAAPASELSLSASSCLEGTNRSEQHCACRKKKSHHAVTCPLLSCSWTWGHLGDQQSLPLGAAAEVGWDMSRWRTSRGRWNSWTALGARCSAAGLPARWPPPLISATAPGSGPSSQAASTTRCRAPCRPLPDMEAAFPCNRPYQPQYCVCQTASV